MRTNRLLVPAAAAVAATAAVIVGLVSGPALADNTVINFTGSYGPGAACAPRFDFQVGREHDHDRRRGDGRRASERHRPQPLLRDSAARDVGHGREPGGRPLRDGRRPRDRHVLRTGLPLRRQSGQRQHELPRRGRADGAAAAEHAATAACVSARSTSQLRHLGLGPVRARDARLGALPLRRAANDARADDSGLVARGRSTRTASTPTARSPRGHRRASSAGRQTAATASGCCSTRPAHSATGRPARTWAAATARRTSTSTTARCSWATRKARRSRKASPARPTTATPSRRRGSGRSRTRPRRPTASGSRGSIRRTRMSPARGSTRSTPGTCPAPGSTSSA